jgi:2-amino-4-hydroxy-6-hydroxymethyldihydropteridine diphosphokinase
MVDVYIGIGSNVGPEENLRDAVSTLRSEFPGIVLSSVYRSPAFGFEGDHFLNLVGRFESDVDACEIEHTLGSIEYGGGRTPSGVRFAPRSLDIDLLMYGQRIDPARRIPRDDVTRYPFVLGPLAEIAPGLEHPITGETMRALWQRMAPSVDIEKLGGVELLDATASPADAAPAVDG